MGGISDISISERERAVAPTPPPSHHPTHVHKYIHTNKRPTSSRISMHSLAASFFSEGGSDGAGGSMWGRPGGREGGLGRLVRGDNGGGDSEDVGRKGGRDGLDGLDGMGWGFIVVVE